MKELVGYSFNTVLSPKKDGELSPMVETILLVSEPKYSADVGGFGKFREILDIRMMTDPKTLRLLASALAEAADEADEMLRRVKDKYRER